MYCNIYIYYKKRYEQYSIFSDVMPGVPYCGSNIITTNNSFIKQSWLYYYLKQSPYGYAMFPPGSLNMINVGGKIYLMYRDAYDNCNSSNLGGIDNNNVNLLERPPNFSSRFPINSVALKLFNSSSSKIIKDGKTYVPIDIILRTVFVEHPHYVVKDEFDILVDKAKDVANNIGDFFKDIPGQVRELVKRIINWVSSNAEPIWNNQIKPIVSSIITIALQGLQCEYIISLEISELDALQVIEPVLYPELRPIVKRVCVSVIEEVMPEISPFIELINDTGLLNEYLDPEIDTLIQKILEKFTHEIVEIITPIVKPLKWTCSAFLPPDDPFFDNL